MINAILVVAALMIQPSPARAGDTEVVPMDAKSAVTVTFEPVVADGALKVRYAVVNHTDGPILVFDRIWDRRAKRVDPNWAYVAIDGKSAIVKRTLARMPAGVRLENPPVPYGREIASGKMALGAFEIPVPVTEADPYDRIRRRKPSLAAEIESAKFEIGWCPKADLAEPKEPAPIVQGGEALWIFGYGVLKNALKSAESAPVPLRVPALAVPPR